MDKYEISLWEDYPDLTSNNIPFLNERKICVIGSDTMTSAARAIEPKLVSNVNGTNTFSFRIYYRYNDEITGEEYINPYLPYIINERKVKVLWKDKWYDLVIKKIEEDTQKRSVLCTCEDLFISELSKNGYELEFNSELQNNSGTAEELTARVLYGSGWQPAENQQSIIQYQEEPVYEVYTQNSIIVTKQSPNGNTSVTIPANKLCLLYQSCIDETCTKIQFFYSASDYITEDNGMLVLNGDCYSFDGHISYNGSQVRIVDNSYRSIFIFSVDDAFSFRYRANRLVGAQLTVFDNLLNRYVDIYENNIYGYETTEYSDPTLVVNLIANPKDFKDTQGWIGGDDLQWQVYPSFTGQNGQTVANYNAKSYLKITSGNTYNTAFVSNKQYLNPNQTDIRNGKLGGFQVGEKYIFRYKAKSSLSSDSYIASGITCRVYKFNIDSSGNYNPTGSNYFSSSSATINDKWTETILTCSKACTANDLSSVGLFINSNSTYYIEDIQFFKLAYGTDIETSTSKRINPGEFSAQSIVKTVYRYYNANHNGVTDAKDLKFLYSGETKQNSYTPVYNNYEKITSIEISKSNRFNILQAIAEKFECWVRFIINHNQETGQVLYDSQGLPQKYVQLVEQIGHDTGISFEYGIDLKGIKRTIVSNTIATKAIIPPNQNEFGKNGFCTIARSSLNYCRENFILNFDYYIQQGLLNRNLLEADLYKTNGTNLGYYFYLNKYNREYDELANAVNARQVELTKQQAAYTVQASNLRASKEKLGDNKSDLATLAGVDNFADAQSYASTHADNRKVQSLMGSIAKLNNSINELAVSTNSLETSINALKSDIQIRNNRMAVLIQNINNLHRAFFRKYSRFIQEGTWQDQNYFDDDKYYLDGLEVAYRSSRPQIQYDISLLRLSGLEDFSSKVFDLGDICYIQDKEFFGYEEDGITPYKQKIIISQLTSYFDTPEKDVIKVQNYSTQFDDLFQRITTATQALEFSQGKYERAAEVVKPDKTLSFALLQDTFDYNKDLVMSSANQEVTWDNTGITVSDTTNSALKVKIMAGGIFASDDGGDTWKNALRGDGISTDLLTAGRINTSEIYVYDGNSPSFRWDSLGINAYTVEKIVDPDTGLVNDKFNFNKFVRFDKFGLYGYEGTEDFEPSTENTIWTNNNVKFGLTWKGFFLRNTSGNSSIEISNQNDILIKTGTANRIQIGKYSGGYGMRINDASGNAVFSVDTTNNSNSIGGWTLTSDSFSCTIGNNKIGLYSNPTNTTINGKTDKYYIVAGSNFGVTAEGGIYASKGKIADCEIVNGKLTIGSSKSKLEDTIMSSSSVTEYRLSNDSDKLSGNYDWSTSPPTWSNGKYIWKRTTTITTKASNPSQEESIYRPNKNGVYDRTLTEALQKATSAESAAANAANAAVRTQTIFFSKGKNDSSYPSAQTTWINTDSTTIETTKDPNTQKNIVSGKQGVWTPVRPVYNSDYPSLYIATQTQTITQQAAGKNACNCTTPQLEVTTTVIDGAHILTGSINANRITVQDLSAFGATIGGFKIEATKDKNGAINGGRIYTSTKSSLDSDDDGVYIGNNGIKLGANFKVTKTGDLYASSGTFTGRVYAGQILSGRDPNTNVNYGTFNGAGITDYSIPGGTAIVSGSIDTGPLSGGVTQSLGYANKYKSATDYGTTDFPTQFTAAALYAASINNNTTGGFVYAQRYMQIVSGASGWGFSSDMQDTLVPTAAHWHTFTEGTGSNAGKIFIGKAIPATSTYSNEHFFNIADTAFYKNAASAAKPNYISFTPKNASSWNSKVSKPGDVHTSNDNHKYIKPNFNLTSGHKTGTSDDYTPYTTGGDFYIDVTDIVGSGSGGVSIDDITIKSASQTGWYPDYVARVDFDSDHVDYDSNSNIIYGRAELKLGTANSTETKSRRLMITMPPVGGSSSSTYTITEGNVTADSSDPYDPSGDKKYILNVLSTFKVDGIYKSFTSFVNVKNVYDAGVAAGGGGEIVSVLGYVSSVEKVSSVDYDKAGDSFSFEESGYYKFTYKSDDYSYHYITVPSSGSSSGGSDRTVSSISYVADTGYETINLTFNEGSDQQINLPQVWNYHISENSSVYTLGYYDGYSAGQDDAGGSSVSIAGYSIDNWGYDDRVGYWVSVYAYDGYGNALTNASPQLYLN